MDFGVIVDLETTGVDAQNDRIIEIGLVEFGLEAGSEPIILRSYGALEDPGVALTAEIQRITGLTDAALAGQRIDWEVVRGFFRRASVAIAHNCEFDRRFLEKSGRLEGLPIHWACSMRHIDWQGKHFRSQALNYLAADHGFVNPFAHRAVFDCATTFRLVAPHLDELIMRSYERDVRVAAVAAPFEAKDTLKRRGYRWSAEERHWWRVVAEGALGTERVFLAEEVYRGASLHAEIPVEGGA
jgi:DNA polymerase-3 subunit epsilon